MRKSFSDKSIDTINVILLLIFAFVCLFPILNVLAISLSGSDAINMGKVNIIPIDIQFESYKAILRNGSLQGSLIYTIILTISSTTIAMLATILAAYPLSKQKLIGRTPIFIFILITMYFSGGLIPDYLLYKNLKLIDTFWVLILPGAISTFNLLVLKTFFSAIPTSLEESATIDGANQWTILWRIILPLSRPAIATISLFYAVGRWNGYSDALFFINSPKLKPLQLVLQQLLSFETSKIMEQQDNLALVQEVNLLPESLKSATIIFATVPILLVYPWLQKYFVKGVMIGSVKG